MDNEKTSGEIDRHLVARIVGAIKELAAARNRKFESISLHRRVQCAPTIVRGANLESKLCDVLLPSVCRAGPHSQRRMMALEALD
jgi:hypothetical protein